MENQSTTSPPTCLSSSNSLVQCLPFSHLILVLGGVQGIEAAVDADQSLELSSGESSSLFDFWLNTCPNQGSRTIRTEVIDQSAQHVDSCRRLCWSPCPLCGQPSWPRGFCEFCLEVALCMTRASLSLGLVLAENGKHLTSYLSASSTMPHLLLVFLVYNYHSGLVMLLVMSSRTRGTNLILAPTEGCFSEPIVFSFHDVCCG